MPFDQLKRENISPIEMANAGGGDPRRAPPELVAVLGDSRFKHWYFAHRVHYHPDGKLLYSKGTDQAICAWDAASGQLRYVLADRPYSNFGLSHDGRQLATGASDGNVALYDATTGTFRRALPAHAKAVVVLAFDRAGKLLATGGEDGAVHLTHIESGQILWKVDAPTQPFLLSAKTGKCF